MADVQLEHGYVTIANELFEALLRARMPDRHKSCALAVVRLLYGWGKTRDRVSASQVAGIVDIRPQDARQILRDLAEWKVITVVAPATPRMGALIEFVKDFDVWEIGATRNSRQRAKGPGDVPARTPESADSGDVHARTLRAGTHSECVRAGPLDGVRAHPTKAMNPSSKAKTLSGSSTRTARGAPEGSARGPEPSEDARAVTDALAAMVLEISPKAKVPQGRARDAWLRECDRMIRIDERKPADVIDAIEWLRTVNAKPDRGYHFVVLSAESLRRKLDAILAAMERERRMPARRATSGGSRPAVPMDVWRRRAKRLSTS